MEKTVTSKDSLSASPPELRESTGVWGEPGPVLAALPEVPAVPLLCLYPAVSVQHVTGFVCCLQSWSQSQLDLTIFLGVPHANSRVACTSGCRCRTGGEGTYSLI